MTDSSPTPHVHLIVLGGTITMSSQPAGGISPTLRGEDLLETMPAIAGYARLTVETPFLVPGASLSFAHLRTVSESVAHAFAAGASGVVVVQGTDTIDETAFLLDLAHAHDRPVVVTGAMRGAEATGADGPANLFAAVLVAASEQSRGMGVLVVLGDEIHAARFVSKTHTALPSAFASPGSGPLGHVVEDEPRFVFTPLRRTNLGPMPELRTVAIVTFGLGDDGKMVDAAIETGIDGLVIEGMGAGHVPASTLPAIDRALTRIPVVLATRVAAGPVFEKTYGFPGSERDLIARGVAPAGSLSAHKARLLLAYLLGLGCSRDEIAERFRSF